MVSDALLRTRHTTSAAPQPPSPSPPLSTQAVMTSENAVRLVKHDFPLVDPRWLRPINLLLFQWLGEGIQNKLFHHLSGDGGEAE